MSLIKLSGVLDSGNGVCSTKSLITFLAGTKLAEGNSSSPVGKTRGETGFVAGEFIYPGIRSGVGFFIGPVHRYVSDAVGTSEDG